MPVPRSAAKFVFADGHRCASGIAADDNSVNAEPRRLGGVERRWPGELDLDQLALGQRRSRAEEQSSGADIDQFAPAGLAAEQPVLQFERNRKPAVSAPVRLRWYFCGYGLGLLAPRPTYEAIVAASQ